MTAYHSFMALNLRHAMPYLGLTLHVGRSASESAGKGNTLNTRRQASLSAPGFVVVVG